MIKNITIYIALSFTLLFNNVIADEIAVDIPAMNNMAVGDPVELDSENGSIIQIATSAMANKKQVVSFYNTELINLGWKKINTNTYSRNGETLIISFGEKDKNGLSVDFTIITPFNNN